MSVWAWESIEFICKCNVTVFLICKKEIEIWLFIYLFFAKLILSNSLRLNKTMMGCHCMVFSS